LRVLNTVTAPFVVIEFVAAFFVETLSDLVGFVPFPTVDPSAFGALVIILRRFVAVPNDIEVADPEGTGSG